MNVYNPDKCVTCLTLGSLHLSEGLTHPKEVTSTFKIQIIKKEGGREGEMFVSERAKLRESLRLWL